MTHHEYIFSIYFWTFSLEKVFGTLSKNKYFSFLDLSPILTKLSLTKPPDASADSHVRHILDAF